MAIKVKLAVATIFLLFCAAASGIVLLYPNKARADPYNPYPSNCGLEGVGSSAYQNCLWENYGIPQHPVWGPPCTDTYTGAPIPGRPSYC